MATLTEKATEKGKEFGHKVSEQVGKSLDSVRSAAGNVVEQAKDAGTHAFAAIEERAEDATGSLSSGLKATARSIRENGPHDGSLGCATSSIAQTFSDSANYLDTQGLKGACSDISNLISRNPIPSFLLGIGIGMLMGRPSRRS